MTPEYEQIRRKSPLAAFGLALPLALISGCEHRILTPIIALPTAEGGAPTSMGGTSGGIRALAGAAAMTSEAGGGAGGADTAGFAGFAGGEIVRDPDSGTPAFNLGITRVEINQGSAVTIAGGDELIPPEARIARIVKRRGGLFRVFAETSGEFAPRPIEARLALLVPGMPLQLQRVIKPVAQSVDGVPDSIEFRFHLSAADVLPSTRFSVGLFEVSPSPAPGAFLPARVPSVGQALLGVDASHLALSVRLVPVSTSVEPSPLFGREHELQNLLYDIHPVEVLDFALMDPIVEDADPYRRVCEIAAERAEPSVYYVGIAPVTVPPGWDAFARCGVVTMARDAMFPSVSYSRLFYVMSALQGLDVSPDNCYDLAAPGYSLSRDQLLGPQGFMEATCFEQPFTWLSPHHFEELASYLATPSADATP